MKRGEVWTVSGGPDYAGKPRPAVIIQSDRFDDTNSIIICPMTSDRIVLPLVRLPILPSDENGLRLDSSIMVDKVMTVGRSKLGRRIGRLTDFEMLEAGRLLAVFLALA